MHPGPKLANFKHPCSAFTLAELLIALSILGVIATFTIPKVLQSQRNQAWNSEAKEAMATISAAYQAYQLNKGANANTAPENVATYFNYVKVATSNAQGTFDGPPGDGTYGCGTGICYYLHNGSLIYSSSGWESFGGTNPTNFVSYFYDPDGKVTGADMTNGSLALTLYYNGKVNLNANQKGTDQSFVGGSLVGGNPWAPTPNWFSW